MIAHNVFKLIAGICLICIIPNCKKDQDQQSRVPYVDVNFTIKLTDPEFIKLTTVGNWEYVTGGSKGIVIYRVSNEEFVAFDRHCPFDQEQVCSQLDVDVTGQRLTDYDCCGSEYSLINGTILKGPATFPIKQYTTSFDGNILIVTN